VVQRNGSPEKQVKFEDEVQQEGEPRRIEAFVLERMHAKVMKDRQERFREGHDKQDKQV
jgi:hypothetical protein